MGKSKKPVSKDEKIPLTEEERKQVEKENWQPSEMFITEIAMQRNLSRKAAYTYIMENRN